MSDDVAFWKIIRRVDFRREAQKVQVVFEFRDFRNIGNRNGDAR